MSKYGADAITLAIGFACAMITVLMFVGLVENSRAIATEWPADWPEACFASVENVANCDAYLGDAR